MLSRVITADNKTLVNNKNNCETSLTLRKQCIKENKEIKETPDNCNSDQQLIQTNKNKRSANVQKCKTDVKKVENNHNIRRNFRQTSKSCETNAHKSKDSVDNSGSSDTEIEDSHKTSSDHKRKLRSKRNHKKCVNSSDSDANGSEEDSEPQVITTSGTVVNNCISVICHDLNQSSNPSKRLDQTSSVNERVGNASQMVPTMCSMDEQLNTSAPNPTKCESFPIRTNVITDKTCISPHLNSGANTSVKVNNDNNNCYHNNNNTTNCENNKSVDELNNLKASIHSLALDRLESVTVYRDPTLVDKQTIRHIESVQHIRHGLMHSSANTTSAPSLTHASDFNRIATGSQSRACQPSIHSPSVSSVPPQYKVKSQPIHPHSSHQSSQSPHLLNTSSHGSHRHPNPLEPQLYHHLMQTSHPMVSGLYSQTMDMFGQKNYPQLSSMPPSTPWNLYNEQIRAQLLHGSDKHQGLRLERERREEKQMKLEKESKEYMERERTRFEMIGKEKEENAKEAVDQHFEESLRLARQKSGWSPISNLPLTKTQPNISRQSHVLPQHQSQHSVPHLPQQPSSHHLQSTLMNEPSGKGSATSLVMEASKHHQMTSRAKPEPSFSLYGYQPNQNIISYITPAQLKENNRLSISSGVSITPLMTGRTDMSKVPPPAAHGLDKRESPKIDRSLTPNSRNSTPIGRPPSLSPKQKSPKMMAPDRVSPLYHRSQGQPMKQYDYSLTNAPPAHQSTSSRSGTPLLSSSPISLQMQTQIPVAHSSQNQEQPQNLVKTDSKSKLNFNEMSKLQHEMQRESPNATIHMKAAPNLPTGYQAYSLIQQGLVPNPLYKALPTTQSMTNPSSMPSVITRPHSAKTSTHSQSQSSHMFPKPGPGIVSGIPICRPNNIPYYEPNRTNQVTNSHKYSPNVSAIKSETSNTYPELNRMAKVSTHSPYNQTQDRNVFQRHPSSSSPHSPRITGGSVHQSPYGPPPGMVSVNSNISQSHTTPPAAHSG
ncbi:unnamed protein product, partial [Medioppia subpectinata]